MATITGVAGVVLVVAGGLAVTPTGGPLDWQPLPANRLVAASNDGHPALVEFTAYWCINCKVLEKMVYVDPGVVREAHHVSLVALRADLTRPHPALERQLAAWGGTGLTFAVVLDDRGRVVARLSGIFTSNAIEHAIEPSVTRGGPR
ncbi:thioredoxin family protein [Oleiagrimonas sp. MCCC 1A03011]|uniref:thioredoxin family protein n=1 Tax=Oleiagrimonas sp. MCCC 1A03011 TaxID=1926883 RepID=UPI00143DBAD4|nr:thioredoxin family protein [Oleiagrimonas sp. MCCC 1A03011]